MRAMAQLKPTISRDRGGHNDRCFACRREPPVPRAQSQLGFPRDVTDDGRQRLVAVVELSADPRRHTVGPGAFDQHAPR